VEIKIKWMIRKHMTYENIYRDDTNILRETAPIRYQTYSILTFCMPRADLFLFSSMPRADLEPMFIFWHRNNMVLWR